MFAKTFALCSLACGDLFLSRRNKNICELAFDSWIARSPLLCEVELYKTF